MASNIGRNALHRGSLKPDRPCIPSANLKSNSIKHRISHPSNLRRHSSPSLASSNAVPRHDGAVPGRVRVAVRLRPQNAEESTSDADFADCVELQPELKRLKLRRNNWDLDTYEFDDVLTEFASQKRVYEVVAKPVVESVLDGFNGTIMAYGQTGTGKTFTLGHLGEEEISSRGIMVRSMEDILTGISLETDSVSVSYFQIYMETIQDLLNPSNDNISIMEDPRTGDVSLPGATIVDIRDQKSFIELLRLGEAHRFAANTKLNTESSRSHAVLMVHIKRCLTGLEINSSNENDSHCDSMKYFNPPIVRKGKLAVVDLAGSERIHKSGSEGHTLEEAKFINLSLSALGKCINALAENSSHVPIRDSKLTRLLKDSFGGSARTSLVVTIGPSPRHRGETTSTVLFGQRAMKVENMLKIKEEFDYKSLSKKLEVQLDKLIAENERQERYFEDELERINLESESRVVDAENNLATVLENEITKTKKLLDRETHLRKTAEEEVKSLKFQLLQQFSDTKAGGSADIINLNKALEEEIRLKGKLEEEIVVLRSQLLNISLETEQLKQNHNRSGSTDVFTGFDPLVSQDGYPQFKGLGNGQKTSVAKLFEQVGLQKILSLLDSEDVNVRIHAVKVLANLAAEEANQEKIVEAGGLTSLLTILGQIEDAMVRRVAAGAIANLAMNEANQELIIAHGGISLLSMTASDAEDPQTLRMVAGAIANLCGNEKLQMKLRTQGGIKALLGMLRCGHMDVLSQVSRGIANFAKCESRAFAQGARVGKSLLLEDGALPWIVENANNEASSIRRHLELALCHLAQHESNVKDMIGGGALWEMVRISRDSSREDIRLLAYNTLTSSSTFRAEMKRLRIDW